MKRTKDIGCQLRQNFKWLLKPAQRKTPKRKVVTHSSLFACVLYFNQLLHQPLYASVILLLSVCSVKVKFVKPSGSLVWEDFSDINDISS